MITLRSSLNERGHLFIKDSRAFQASSGFLLSEVVNVNQLYTDSDFNENELQKRKNPEYVISLPYTVSQHLRVHNASGEIIYRIFFWLIILHVKAKLRFRNR